MEVMNMTILKKLKDYLEKNQVRFEVGYHERVYTSQEIAAAMHVPGKELTKVIMVKADGKMVMLVLPASYRVETKKLKKVLKCKRLGISKEKDFEELFLDDYAIMCFFNKVMLQAEFDDLILLLLV